MTETTVKIDGIEYYTLLEGPDAPQKARPILLCHALMSNLQMWDDTVKALNEVGYSTLRFDHIGHRNTPPPKDVNTSYHMDDIARHMHTIVEAVTGQKKTTAVIGCSIGGVLALRYAMLFPDDVGKVISIAAPGIAAPEKAHGLWTQRVEQFRTDMQTGQEILAHQTVERWFPGSRPRDIATREKALSHVKTCSFDGYRVLADTIRDYDYTEELGKVKAQTLIIAGSEDAAASPEHLEEAAGRIEGARYLLMEGAGHLPPMHLVEEFDRIAVGFFGEDE